MRSTIGWVCLFLVLGYVSLNVFFSNNDVNLALDTIISVLGLYVVLKYARQSIIAVFTGSGASPDYLLFGITLSWFAQAGRSLGSIVARLSSFDAVWLNSEYFGWVKIITVVAAIYHVVPAGAIKRDGKESIPAPSRFGLAGALGLSIVLTVLLLNYRPNLRPMIDQMPGWSRDMFQTGARQHGRALSAAAQPPD